MVKNTVPNKEELLNFVSACNEFIQGKFILADIKISKILRTISQSSLIYDLIAENLINYDFKKEIEKVSEGLEGEEKKNLTLPENVNFIIPFVFSLLVEIDSKKIDFNEFLSLYFPLTSSQIEEYNEFAKEIILPFKKAIIDFFDIDESSLRIAEDDDSENDVISELFSKNNIKNSQVTLLDKNFSPPNKDEKYTEDDELNVEDEYMLLFDNLSRTCNIIIDKANLIRNELKRSNLILVCEALIEASELKNLTITSALIMSLNMLGKHERSLNKELNQINNICYELFSK